jgi:hypothetical protein
MRNRTVIQNDQHPYEGSRWVLYHGTSTARLKRILEDGRLRTSGTDNPKISLTTERSVAEYWAYLAVFGDRRNRPGEDSSEVVLVIDGEGLLELNYDLSAFSDPIWGEGECDWENEIACWNDIEPLEEVLMAVEPVPPERYQTLIERGRGAFKPAVPPIAAFELTVMANAIGKLAEDEITPADADGVVSALAALRSALGSSGDRSTPSST